MLKLKLNIQTITLLIGGLILLSLFVWLVCIKDSMWDLILNLSSEALGMIVTIGIIDSILKIQEEKKWKPALGMIYGDILKTTENLLFEIVPPSLRKLQIRTFAFSKTKITLEFSFDLGNTELLEKKLEENVEKLIGTVSINDLHRQLDYILRFSGFILDPTVFHLLVELDRAVTIFRRLPMDFTEDLRDDYAKAYQELALAGHKLYEHLVFIADRSVVNGY